MVIGFIVMCLTCSVLNIFFLNKEKKRTFILYSILIAVLNLIYLITTVYKGSLNISNYFDVFSINMLLYLAVCDITDMQLPVIAFAIYGAMGVVASFFGDFISTIIFAVVIFIVLLLASKKSKEAIGQGDVFAIARVALFNSTADTMSIVVISLIISLLYGIINSIIRKTGMKTMVAYIPFLFIACYLIKLIY